MRARCDAWTHRSVPHKARMDCPYARRSESRFVTALASADKNENFPPRTFRSTISRPSHEEREPIGTGLGHVPLVGEARSPASHFTEAAQTDQESSSLSSAPGLAVSAAHGCPDFILLVPQSRDVEAYLCPRGRTRSAVPRIGRMLSISELSDAALQRTTAWIRLCDEDRQSPSDLGTSYPVVSPFPQVKSIRPVPI